MPEVDSGDTAWLLVSAALVLFMIPALAMFYGGFVSSKMVVATMMQSFVALAVSSLLWALLSFSLAFGPGSSSGSDPYIGGASLGAFDFSDNLYPGTLVPEHAYMVFQLAFAAITAAVVSGSVVGRTTTAAWVLFVAFWQLLVYVPLARWVFYSGGWLAQQGVLDFAGGLVVETNSGVSAYVLAAVVGAHQRWLDRRRVGGDNEASSKNGARAKLLAAADEEPLPGDTVPAGGHTAANDDGHASKQQHSGRPHDVTYILLGAGLLLFGWLGFNAGSAIEAKFIASRAFVNTVLAASAGMVGFCATEVGFSGDSLGKGRPTAVGAATGVVVGLVAITPACGYVSQMSSLAIGAVTAFCCYFAEHGLKHHVPHVQDTLNCLAGHGVGGMLGIIAVGLCASKAEDSPTGGLLCGGGGRLLGVQLLGILVTVAVAAVGTCISWFLAAGLLHLCGAQALVPPDAAADAHLHGEEAYGDTAAFINQALAASLAEAGLSAGSSSGGGAGGEESAARLQAVTHAVLAAVRRELGMPGRKSSAGSGLFSSSPVAGADGTRMRLPSIAYAGHSTYSSGGSGGKGTGLGHSALSLQ